MCRSELDLQSDYGLASRHTFYKVSGHGHSSGRLSVTTQNEASYKSLLKSVRQTSLNLHENDEMGKCLTEDLKKQTENYIATLITFKAALPQVLTCCLV